MKKIHELALKKPLRRISVLRCLFDDSHKKRMSLILSWRMLNSFKMFFSRNCCASSYDTTFGDLEGFCNSLSIFVLRKFLSTDKVFLDSSFRVPWEFPEGFCQDFWNIAWIIQSYYRKSAPHQGSLQSLLKNPFMCSSLTDQATQFSQDIISAKFYQDWFQDLSKTFSRKTP